MDTITYEGLDAAEYLRVLEAGIDHGGNPIESFIDHDGGMPMRCCLADSEPGDSVAIVAWSPFPWQGVYTETGPIFIHAAGCSGLTPGEALPDEFDARNITLRPYGHGQTIAYDLVRHVEAGAGLHRAVAELLDESGIDFVHGRNQTGGCYAFTARRAGSRDVRADRPT